MKTKGTTFANFYWQNGYDAFSVSQSNVESVRRYIAKQEDQHRRVSFQEECREFLKRYEGEYDERYVWDYLRLGLPLTTSTESRFQRLIPLRLENLGRCPRLF